MKSYSCENCGRQLTDTESIARGFGPDCAARRASFLASCGTSEAELATLEAASGDAAKWVRNFKTDMRRGRIRDGNFSIGAARRKAEDARQYAQESAPAAVAAPEVVASEPPQAAIVVRASDRGFRVHPPYRHPQFVAAFKRTVSGRWYADAQEWFIPAVCLDWAIELLEYWFSMPVYVEQTRAGS